MTKIDEETTHKATAYHEAGHAVVAMHCGWRISPRGIEIGNDEGSGYTGYRIPVDDMRRDNPRAVVALAGWLAEHHWHGQGKKSHFDDGSILAECAEWIEDDPDDPEGPDDAEDALLHLRGLHPELDGPGLVALCRKYEAEAKDLVEQLWSRIERLARRLLRKGKLGPGEAHQVAGYPQPGYLAESDEATELIETPLYLLVESLAALVVEVHSLNARVRLLQETVESELGSRAALSLEMFRCGQATNVPAALTGEFAVPPSIPPGSKLGE